MRWRSRRRSATEHGSEPSAPAPADEGHPDPGRDASGPAEEATPAGQHVRVHDDPPARGEQDPGHAGRSDAPSERSPSLIDDERAAAWLDAVTEASIEHQWSSGDAVADTGGTPTGGAGAPTEAAGAPAGAADAATEGPPAAPAPPHTPAGPPPPAVPWSPTLPVVVDEAAWATAARDIVRRALDEDLDVAGDVTAEATVPPEAVGTARVVARADGVAAGLALIAEVYDQLDPRVEVRTLRRDGDRVGAGEVVAEVVGPLRSVLTGERTALNLITLLSGVATITARYVEAVAGTGCEVRDTRKTTPGLRLLEKAAVRAGGGVNHRIGLSDALLVKENHVVAAGGVAEATRAALAGARGRDVQVEVESLEELDEAVAAGARDVLLDNFDLEQTRQAVERARQLAADHGRIRLESSGGLDLDRARAHAQAGVDRIAIGALTHSAPQLDLAVELERPATARAHTGSDEPDGPAGRRSP